MAYWVELIQANGEYVRQGKGKQQTNFVAPAEINSFRNFRGHYRVWPDTNKKLPNFEFLIILLLQTQGIKYAFSN